MSNHTMIRNAIATMEQGRFQLLCGHYLARTTRGDLQMPGAVDRNEKTRKGRPDIFMLLPDGTFLLSECTTKDDRDQNQLLEKLKKDLEGCLDFASLGLTVDQVNQIVLCFNGSIDPTISAELKRIAAASGIPLRLVGLATLAEYFYSVDRVYARDELGVPFDTGQVLTKGDFLGRYRKRELATPLDNPIIGRDRELTNLAQLLEQHEIIILTGAAGVGKSRLALQAIDAYLLQHAEAEAYYIFNKSGGITDDLITYLQPDGHYVLMLDDANRKPDNLIAALDSALNERMKIKLVVTVRDYALHSVVECCRNRDFKRFHVDQLDREAINRLLTETPFQIASGEAVERILFIAQGNPRLAIMAAQVYLKEQGLAAIADVTSIYDQYFAPVIDDLAVLNDNLYLRVLGLVAFFNSIDVEMEFDQGVLKQFNIPVEEFLEAASQLEAQEVVEIYQHSTVKITEQVLATYLFYEVFFHKQLLSFELLLNTYFVRNHARFTDSLNPAIQAFGTRIIDENRQTLLNFWDSIQANKSDAYQVLSLFGRYLPEQTLAFAAGIIRDTPESDEEFMLPKHYHSPSGYPHEPVLALLAQFYDRHDDKLISSVALALRYVAKQKSSIAKVIDQMKTHFAPTDEDFSAGFSRQQLIIDWLIQQFDKSQEARLIYDHVFYHILINRFYGREYYCQTENGPAFIDTFGQLRSSFLQKLFEFPEIDRPFIIQLLLDYLDQEPHLYPFMVASDLKQFEELALKQLDPHSFTECYFVSAYKELLNNKGVATDEFLTKWMKKFRTPAYRLFEKLTFRSAKYRERFTTSEAFTRLEDKKSKDLNKMLPMPDLQSFKRLYATIDKIYTFPDRSKTDLSSALSMLLTHAFKTNEALGFELLEFYLTKEQQSFFNPLAVYTVLFARGHESIEKLYTLLQNVKFKYQQQWMERYFDWLPEDAVTPVNLERLLCCYQKASNGLQLFPQYFMKYENKKPGVVAELLKILADKRQLDSEFQYRLSHDFFRTFDYLVKEQTDLCIKVYLQQEDIDLHYDLYGDEFFFIFDLHPDFFMKFFDFMLDKLKETQRDIGKYLSRIWNYEQAEDLVFSVLVRLRELDYYSYVSHPGSVFFVQLNEAQQERAITVIKKLVSAFPDDRQNANIALDIVRHTIPLYFDDLLRHLVSTNSDPQFFGKLDFYPNHFSANGKWQIWADYKAQVLRDVAEAIRQLPNAVDYLEHQEILSRRIHIQKANADMERKLIFRGFR
ncbi:MAG: nSTAND3 domain-containing NTPase [Mucilaginibacter sp.]